VRKSYHHAAHSLHSCAGSPQQLLRMPHLRHHPALFADGSFIAQPERAPRTPRPPKHRRLQPNLLQRKRLQYLPIHPHKRHRQRLKIRKLPLRLPQPARLQLQPPGMKRQPLPHPALPRRQKPPSLSPSSPNLTRPARMVTKLPPLNWMGSPSPSAPRLCPVTLSCLTRAAQTRSPPLPP